MAKFKFDEGFIKKLEKSDKLVGILRNLVWLRDKFAWESKLQGFRKEEYEKEIQTLILVIVEELLQEIKKHVEETKKTS